MNGKGSFIEAALPFGLRSAPGTYDRLARALVYIAKERGISSMVYYVDDHSIVSLPGVNEEQANDFVQLAQEMGVHLSLDKLVVGQTVASFIGFEIDTIAMTVSLGEHKRVSLVSVLAGWLNKKSATRKELEQLVGQLGHASRVIPPGRTYMQTALDLMRKLPADKPRHHVTIPARTRLDLEAFIRFCAYWNGTALIARPPAPHVVAASDASSTIGAGGFHLPGAEWFFLRWDNHHNVRIDTSDPTDNSITYKELFGVVILAALLAPVYSGSTITILCDNTGAVARVAHRHSRVPEILELVRILIDVEARHDVAIVAEHIEGENNTIADAISRGRAHEVIASAGLNPTPSALPHIIREYEQVLIDRYRARGPREN